MERHITWKLCVFLCLAQLCVTAVSNRLPRHARLLQDAEPQHLSRPPASTCPQQNFTSPADSRDRWYGVFGWATATTSSGNIIVISAPGEQPSDGKIAGGLPFIQSKGNVYYTTAKGAAPHYAAATAASTATDVGTASTAGPAWWYSKKPAHDGYCTYNSLQKLELPPMANGYGQGFGLGLAATPDGSTLVAGIAGCYVRPGGSPPLCPSFPGADQVSQPPHQVMQSGNTLSAAGGLSCSNKQIYTDTRFAIYGCHCTPPESANGQPNCNVTAPGSPGLGALQDGDATTTVEMDILWIYKLKRSGSYVLDKEASKQIKVTGSTVTNQTIYPNLFYYSTPVGMWPSISEAGDTIAVNVMLSLASKDSQSMPVTSPTGVQVFKRGRSGKWSKVLFLKNTTKEGSPCQDNSDNCWQYYSRAATISPSGNILATTWGIASTAGFPVTLHAWNGKEFVLTKVLEYTQETAPIVAPTFSPDGSVMAIGSVRYDEAAKELHSFIELHSVSVKWGPKPSIATSLVCSLNLPGSVNPMTLANGLGDLQLFWGSMRGVLRLAASRSGNNTFIWDIPVSTNRHSLKIKSCPAAASPSYSVPAPTGFGDAQGTGWGSAGSQAFSVTKVVAGQPGAAGISSDNPSMPLPAAGAATVTTFA